MNRYERHIELKRVLAEKAATAKRADGAADPVGPAPGFDYARAFDRPETADLDLPDPQRYVMIYGDRGRWRQSESESMARSRNVMRELAANLFR